jgi:hypothetical protein
MVEWLCSLARATKVLCSSLGATRDKMILDKSLTIVCLGSLVRWILITCDRHRPWWLVSVYGELKWLSGETRFQAGLLSRATVINSCRKNVVETKLSPDSTLYRNAGYSSSILNSNFSFFLTINRTTSRIGWMRIIILYW